MRDRLKWLSGVCGALAFGLGLLAAACGSTSESPRATSTSAGAGGGGGQTVTGGAGGGSGGTGGQPCVGSDCPPDEPPDPLSAMQAQACRDYFTAVCDRIVACAAPTFRPCESPIDACPDILFAEGSAWTVEQAVACTSEWATHDCAALSLDQGPACAQVLGARPSGSACVFDSQCQTGRCNGGIVPTYDAGCGVCGDVAPSHGACSPEHVCPLGEICDVNTCFDMFRSATTEDCLGVLCPDGEMCEGGFCVAQVALGEVCGPAATCAAGLGCEIELVGLDVEEPATGTCQPLPAIGAPCQPSFHRFGLCADGATCNGRPTGDCVPLAEVGEPCGFARCVAGAYCNVLDYDHVDPYVCHPLGQLGDPCDHSSRDLGGTGCAEDLLCVCLDAECEMTACNEGRQEGESCNGTTEFCAYDFVCVDSLCADPSVGTGTQPAGSPCLRTTDFGRHDGACAEGLECLCTAAECEQSLCALPRVLGENCNGTSEICRQGLGCEAGQCVERLERDLEAESCTPP